MWVIQSVSLGLCLFWMIGVGLWGPLEAKYSESGLCPSATPDPPTVSCGAQLWSLNSSNNCTLLFAPKVPSKNSGECDGYEFVRDDVTAPDKFGKVSLKAYYYVDINLTNWQQSAFNVSFSDIKWTNLKLRFKEHGRNNSNFCRAFIISSHDGVPEESQLFYDCLWSDQVYEGKPYFFEYHASNKSDKHASVGKYLFFVPNYKEINPNETLLNKTVLFVYMDLSSLPLLQLRLQVPLGRFPLLGLGPEHFLVVAHHNTTSQLQSSRLACTSDLGHELIYEYDTRNLGGQYHFTAQIKHSNCTLFEGGCLVAKTPVFYLEDDVNLRLLIGIVGCGGSILSISVLMYFLWRWSQVYRKKSAPTVLIIYVPTTDAHIRCVVELAKFLKKACHINAVLDELEIPQTKTQDPFTWCNEAFLRSDFVMVLSSPNHQTKNYEGIYRNVDALGLRNLKEKLSDCKSTQQFFAAILPYCSKTDIPPEAGNLKSFFLMKDLNKMLSFLHSTPFKVNLESNESGGALLDALGKAAAESGARDSAEYQKLLLDDLSVESTAGADWSEELLLPAKVKAMPETLDMYPGPIDDLNLLGTEGEDVPGNGCVRKPPKNVIDLNELDL